MSRRAPAPADDPADDPAVAADRPDVDGSRRALTGRAAALVVLVVAEGTWLATRDVVEGGGRWVPLGVVVALHLALVVAEHRRPVLGAPVVLAAAAVVGLVAVVVPPFGSQDLYLYASYGRMVTAHQLNPHLAGPEVIGGDVVAAHVAHAWRDHPSAYGPVFTGWSALGAALYGDSPLRARLFFQASAVGALLVVTWYLHRRGRPPAVLLAVGLSPVLLATANGGHNDLLAGVLSLVGVDLVVRRRSATGAVLVALAIAVKALLVPVAGVVVLAAAVAGRRREAVRDATVIVGVLVAAYLAVGGLDALAPLREVNQAVSRGSLWGALSRDDGANLLLRSDGWAQPLARVLVAGALALLAWRARRPVDVVVLATAAGVVVCFGADYTLPWYAAGFLPLAALSSSLPARALAVGATIQLFVYVQPPGDRMADLVGAINAAFVGGLLLAVLLVVTVTWVVADGWGRRARPASRQGGGVTPPDPGAPVAVPRRSPRAVSRTGS